MDNLYDIWFNSDKLTAQEKLGLQILTPEEKIAYFPDENLKFGTAGIRATMGLGTTRLNRFTYGQIFHGLAKYLIGTTQFGESTSVVIAHDNRLNGDSFAVLGAKILNHYGIKVFLFKKNKPIPTPILSYAVRYLRCNSGINITASHNPKEFNGIKIYNASGGQITTQDVGIAECFCFPKDILNTEINYELTNTEYLNNEVIEHYFHDARNSEIDHTTIHASGKKMPFVLCTNQGAASKLLPKYLRFLGYKKCKVVRDQARIDPYFSNTLCANPEDETSFTKSYILANRINASVCIGVDPDGDRMAVSIKKNGKWNLLSGNETGTIFVYYILANRKIAFNRPYVVASFVTTNIIDRIAAAYGAHVVRTGTGFKWMGEVVTNRESGYSFVAAFEESIGALLSPINRDKDSFTASTLLLEIITKYKMRGMDLIDLLEKEIYPKFGYNYSRTISYVYQDLQFVKLLNQKMHYFKRYPLGQFGKWTIQSIKWNNIGDCLEWDLGNNCWIKFRKSGTEPKFKVYICLYGSSNLTVKQSFEELKAIFDSILKPQNTISTPGSI